MVIEILDGLVGIEPSSIRYYGKDGWPNLICVDFHEAKEVPKGTCNAILKAAGIPKP